MERKRKNSLYRDYSPEDRGHGEVERIMRVQKPDFVQINYSLMDRAAAGVSCHSPRNLGWLSLSIVLSEVRHISGHFQETAPGLVGGIRLPFLGTIFVEMDRVASGRNCVIPATNDPRHLEDNMGRASAGCLMPKPGRAWLRFLLDSNSVVAGALTPARSWLANSVSGFNAPGYNTSPSSSVPPS